MKPKKVWTIFYTKNNLIYIVQQVPGMILILIMTMIIRNNTFVYELLYLYFIPLSPLSSTLLSLSLSPAASVSLAFLAFLFSPSWPVISLSALFYLFHFHVAFYYPTLREEEEEGQAPSPLPPPPFPPHPHTLPSSMEFLVFSTPSPVPFWTFL